MTNQDLDPIGKWKQFYESSKSTQPYGAVETYADAAEFLDGLKVVEDWGCGYAYARQFFKRSKYVGVDGTKSIHCDVVDDLRTRATNPEGIMLRGILEHNIEWRKLLQNVLYRARKKIWIGFFMDFLPEQGPVVVDPSSGIPTFQLSEDDVDAVIKDAPTRWRVRKDKKVFSEETWHMWRLSRL